jgi:hypothetical protein
LAHPGGKTFITWGKIFGSFTRTPNRSPQTRNEIPAAHPRRSSFAIQAELRLYLGKSLLMPFNANGQAFRASLA